MENKENNDRFDENKFESTSNWVSGIYNQLPNLSGITQNMPNIPEAPALTTIGGGAVSALLGYVAGGALLAVGGGFVGAAAGSYLLGRKIIAAVSADADSVLDMPAAAVEEQNELQKLSQNLQAIQRLKAKANMHGNQYLKVIFDIKTTQLVQTSDEYNLEDGNIVDVSGEIDPVTMHTNSQ